MTIEVMNLISSLDREVLAASADDDDILIRRSLALRIRAMLIELAVASPVDDRTADMFDAGGDPAVGHDAAMTRGPFQQ